jgi:hypothetical protein
MTGNRNPADLMAGLAALPPEAQGGQIITPQMAQMAQVNVIPKTDVRVHLIQCASVLDECRSKITAKLADISQLHGIIEHSVKVLDSVQLRGGVDRSVIAGSDDATVLGQTLQILAGIVDQLGEVSGALLHRKAEDDG